MKNDGMNSDLPQRLRELYVQNGTNYVQAAADEHERLTAQVAALEAERDALELVLEALVNRCNTEFVLAADEAVITAEAALERLYKRRIDAARSAK
jgi:hypothetical protein